MKIFYFSLLDWYVTKQRPQHLAEELSKYYEVLYFNILPFNKKEMKPHKEGDDVNKKKISQNKNMKIRRIRLIPKNSLLLIKAINTILLKFHIKYFLKINSYEVLWLTHPSHVKYIPRDYSGKIIYDCMDKYDQFSRNTKILSNHYKNESKIIKKADLIFTSSKLLLEDLACKGAKNISLINNATLYNSFNIDSELLTCPSDIDPSVKTVGYFGGIGAWFDSDLLVKIATELKHVNFIIIGPISEKIVKDKCNKLSNIYFLGPKNFDELPSYLNYFDVCILPFVVNELIKYVDPVKVYEYLSAGKPVVTPYYDELLKFSDYIYISKGHDEFLNNIKLSLEENEINKLKRLKFAARNTWKQRTLIIKESIEKLM